jgi:hypothetical protein
MFLAVGTITKGPSRLVPSVLYDKKAKRLSQGASLHKAELIDRETVDERIIIPTEALSMLLPSSLLLAIDRDDDKASLMGDARDLEQFPTPATPKAMRLVYIPAALLRYDHIQSYVVALLSESLNGIFLSYTPRIRGTMACDGDVATVGLPDMTIWSMAPRPRKRPIKKRRGFSVRDQGPLRMMDHSRSRPATIVIGRVGPVVSYQRSTQQHLPRTLSGSGGLAG